MTIGNVIASYRKNMGLTQDGLAQQLGVTNQAVSKWESDQSCPDIALLPKIADIFGITIDELFGREKPQAEPVELIPAPAAEINDLPWPDDDTLHVVIYKGHTYLASCPEQERITFEYDGPAMNIDCAVNLNCEDVAGDVRADGNVNCDAVEGNVQARGNVACDAVAGSVTAEGSVNCDDVAGSVSAGGSVTCDSIDGNVNAGGNVTCDEVEGSVYVGGNVICDEILGNATAGGTVSSDGENRGHIHITIGDTDEDDEKCGSNCDGNCESCEYSGFTYSLGNKNGKSKKDKKAGRIHISVNDADEVTVDETLDKRINNAIEKFVNDIIRKSTDFHL